MEIGNGSKMLIITQLFFVFGFSAIAGNEIIEEIMSPEEIQSFFGTRDGKVPKYEVANILFPAKFKRAAESKFTLVFDIPDHNKINVTLNRIEDNYLIGKSTGIWFAESNTGSVNSVKYTPKPSILKNLGNFYFYQNLKSNSALTVFNSPNGSIHMSGIVNENYAIRYLDFHPAKKILSKRIQVISHDIKIRSLDSNSDEYNYPDEYSLKRSLHVIYKIPENYIKDFHDEIVPSKYISKRNKRRSNESIPSVVYPKLLLTMDFESVGADISAQLIYFISLWNTVDLVYRHLRYPKVRLSVTGIIIPTDSKATPYVAEDTKLISEISGYMTVNSIAKYFEKEEIRFPLDSYDIIVFMTTKFICRDNVGEICRRVSSHSKITGMCLKSPRRNVETISMSIFDGTYDVTSLLAHDLAHTLGVVDHDGTYSMASCSESKNYIMSVKSGFDYRERHFTWSSCSAQSISTYLGSARRYCVHKPPVKKHSILYDKPGAWLSLSGQCQNNDLYSSVPCVLPGESGICSRFGCKYAILCGDSMDPTLNGTSCKTSSGNSGYCQSGKCLDLP